MSVLFSAEVEQSLDDAWQLAKSLGHEYVGSEHVLVMILKSLPVENQSQLAQIGLTAELIESGMRYIEESERRDLILVWSPRLLDVIEWALRKANSMRRIPCDIKIFAYALLLHPSWYPRILESYSISSEHLEECCNELLR